MQRSIIIRHLGPKTSYVSSEYEVSCALSPDYTSKFAHKVDITPENIIKNALINQPPVTKALGIIKIKITQ